jgi:hypothetical protein
MMNAYAIARDAADGRQYYTAKDSDLWTDELAHAAWCGDEDEADRMAGDWNSYWQTKGYGLRAFVVRFTEAELEAEGL